MEVIQQIIDKLKFENYLETFGISVNEVKEKLKIEILWNQLISGKFQNQINIDENKIRQNVKNEKMNYKEVINYISKTSD